jgi:hypothetical protein
LLLSPEARRSHDAAAVIDLHGRSADASRIVQARLPILRRDSCSVRYSPWRDLVTRSESRWQSLDFDIK